MAPPEPRQPVSSPPPWAQPEPEVGQQLPPPASPLTTVQLVKLAMRVLVTALSFISLIILLTNNTDPIIFNCSGVIAKLKFSDVITYRYMLFTILLAFVYSLYQTALLCYQLSVGFPLSYSLVKFDFYGDLALLYTLATGAAAGFGATVDLRNSITGSVLDQFFAKGGATSSMLLVASISAAVSLVLSR